MGNFGARMRSRSQNNYRKRFSFVFFTDFYNDDYVSTYDKMTLIVPDECKEAYVSVQTPLRGENGYW